MGEFRRDLLPDPISYFEAEGLLFKERSGKWRTTRCEFHDGSDSMRGNTQTGAYVCMAACGAKGGDVLSYHMHKHGLGFVEAARALGAYIDDDKPHRGSARPMTLPARSALEVLAVECNLIAVVAMNTANGVLLSDEDRTRHLRAIGRVIRIAEEVAQ